MTSNDEIDADEELVGEIEQRLLHSLIPGRSLYLKIRNFFVLFFWFGFVISWPVILVMELLDIMVLRTSEYLYNLYDKIVIFILVILLFLNFRQMKRMQNYALFVTSIGILIFIWSGTTLEYRQDEFGNISKFFITYAFVLIGAGMGSIGLNHFHPNVSKDSIFPFKYFISRETGKVANSYSTKQIISKESLLFPLFVTLIISPLFHVLFVVLDIFPKFGNI